MIKKLIFLGISFGIFQGTYILIDCYPHIILLKIFIALIWGLSALFIYMTVFEIFHEKYLKVIENKFKKFEIIAVISFLPLVLSSGQILTKQYYKIEFNSLSKEAQTYLINKKNKSDLEDKKIQAEIEQNNKNKYGIEPLYSISKILGFYNTVKFPPIGFPSIIMGISDQNLFVFNNKETCDFFANNFKHINKTKIYCNKIN